MGGPPLGKASLKNLLLKKIENPWGIRTPQMKTSSTKEANRP